MMRRCAALALLAASQALAQPVAEWGADHRFELAGRNRNGEGVAGDPGRTHALILNAAKEGNPQAMFVLSNRLAEGDGIARDEAQARKWLEAAAALEHPEALQHMAMQVEAGTMGYRQDPARAAQLLREAAHALKHRAQGDKH